MRARSSADRLAAEASAGSRRPASNAAQSLERLRGGERLPQERGGAICCGCRRSAPPGMRCVQEAATNASVRTILSGYASASPAAARAESLDTSDTRPRPAMPCRGELGLTRGSDRLYGCRAAEVLVRAAATSAASSVDRQRLALDRRLLRHAPFAAGVGEEAPEIVGHRPADEEPEDRSALRRHRRAVCQSIALARPKTEPVTMPARKARGCRSSVVSFISSSRASRAGELDHRVVVADVDELVMDAGERVARRRASAPPPRPARSPASIRPAPSRGTTCRPTVELVSGSNGRPSPSAVRSGSTASCGSARRMNLPRNGALGDADRAALAFDRRAMGERRAAERRRELSHRLSPARRGNPCR